MFFQMPRLQNKHAQFLQHGHKNYCGQCPNAAHVTLMFLDINCIVQRAPKDCLCVGKRLREQSSRLFCVVWQLATVKYLFSSHLYNPVGGTEMSGRNWSKRFLLPLLASSSGIFTWKELGGTFFHFGRVAKTDPWHSVLHRSWLALCQLERQKDHWFQRCPFHQRPFCCRLLYTC